jgi:vancomycin resistance protein YoaR
VKEEGRRKRNFYFLISKTDILAALRICCSNLKRKLSYYFLVFLINAIKMLFDVSNLNMGKKMKFYSGKVNTVAVIVISAIMLCVVGGSIFAASALPEEGRILRNVMIAGVSVGDLTREEAKNILFDKYKALLDKEVILKVNGKDSKYKMAQLGLKTDFSTAVQSAFDTGRKGSFMQRVADSVSLLNNPLTLPAPLIYSRTMLDKEMLLLEDKYKFQPVNASVKFNATTKKIDIIPEKNGGKMNSVKAANMIEEQLLKPALVGTSELPVQIDMPFEPIVPAVIGDMLKPIDTVLGEYTTSFATSSKNRCINITTGSASLNGLVVAPGDVASFNKIVGPRTAECGYKIAPVIINGEVNQGLGGGMCQVSTTLYNAVLLANLEIVDRTHHSIPSHYVPLGMDATVVYGAKDFKFKNNTANPIVVQTIVAGRKVTMKILGKGPKPVVSIERTGITSGNYKVRTVKNEKLSPGTKKIIKKGSPGRGVTIYRIVGTGKDAKREFVSEDKYVGETRVIQLGPAKAKPGDIPIPAAPVDPDEPMNPEL